MTNEQIIVQLLNMNDLITHTCEDADALLKRGVCLFSEGHPEQVTVSEFKTRLGRDKIRAAAKKLRELARRCEVVATEFEYLNGEFYV
jgi:hypothetical protein